MAMAETMTMRPGYWIRLQPTTQGEGVRINDREQVVTVVETGNGWSLVRFADGRRYWVSASSLVEYVNVGTVQTLPDYAQVYYAAQDNWPVRSHAGTRTAGSEIIDYVSSSTPLQLLATERDGDGDLWYKVQYADEGQLRIAYIYEGRVRADRDDQTESCTNCVSFSILGVQAQAERITTIAQGDAEGYDLGPEFHPACSRFINRDGLGELGRMMVASAQKIAPDCFYNNRQIFADFCPNYRSLSESRKNALIALVFAAIAEQESDCNASAQNPNGTNDIADGLFQLEYSRSQREDAGRNRQWCSTDRPVNSQSYTFQSECAVSIVEDTICSRNRKLNWRRGYWDELRRNGRITRLIKNEIARWNLCD